jgi:hypothetical protein
VQDFKFEDAGCEVSDSCLNCPLPRCKYDDPVWYQKHRRLAKDLKVLTVMRTEKLSVEEAAERFSVTVRTIFRIMRRSREDALNLGYGDLEYFGGVSIDDIEFDEILKGHVVEQIPLKSPDSVRDSRISAASSSVRQIIFNMLPQWFIDTFDESLVDDLFNIAKEEGGKIWWLKLAIVASQFVVKFALRRFGHRKAAEKSGPLPQDRGDDGL